MRDWIQAAARHLGYVVHRWPTNRFEGIPDTLALLAAAGFTPTVIVDGGANVGAWTRLARQQFPAATIHMVEPQPECHATLTALMRSVPGLVLHPVALSAPSASRVTMAGVPGGTGVFVTADAVEGSREVPAATLDTLFAGGLASDDRVLLKLDLEGHEVTALAGGAALLPRVDAVLIEARVFRPDHAPNGQTFTDVFRVLDAQGFDLYDIASLHGRRRDQRLRMLDAVFVRRGSPLATDTRWD